MMGFSFTQATHEAEDRRQWGGNTRDCPSVFNCIDTTPEEDKHHYAMRVLELSCRSIVAISE